MYDAQIGRWHCLDPMAESYYSQSSYHFSGNNPIRFVDSNGMFYDEWEYNIDTKETIWVSDKGGNETQYVNFVDNKGSQIGEVSVSGSEAHVYDLRDGWIVTNFDAMFDNENYNKSSNYEYTREEFKLRNGLLKDRGNPIRTYILSQESEGNAFPIVDHEQYSFNSSRLKSIIQFSNSKGVCHCLFSVGNKSKSSL